MYKRQRLAAEMGEGLGFRQTGVMYLAKTQREIDGFEAWTEHSRACLLYTSDAADERSSVDLGGRRIIKKKKKRQKARSREHINKKEKRMRGQK